VGEEKTFFQKFFSKKKLSFRAKMGEVGEVFPKNVNFITIFFAKFCDFFTRG